MDQDERMKRHEDEVMAAFDKLRADMKRLNEEDEIVRSSKIKESAHTQVVAAHNKSGVIDRDEWDRILAELDSKKAEKEVKTSAAVSNQGASTTATRVSRAARHQQEEETPKKSAFAFSSLPKKEKLEEKPIKEEKPVRETKTVVNEYQDATPIEEAPKKKKKKKKRKASGFWQTIKYIIIAIVGIGIIGCGAAGAIVYKIVKDTPEINPNNIYDLLSQSSVIYDINGKTVDNIYSGNSLRTNVEYSEIPDDLINAFVSIEDKTFFKHHGFNFVRIAGAVWNKVTGKASRIGGTSTITQQLARNIYLTKDRDIVRKIREAYYTVVIEKALSKEQILEAYLNTIYLGFNSDGVSAAARAYFDKDLSELTLIECAQLAALPQSPNTYSPLKRVAVTNVKDPSTLDIIEQNETYITYYNDAGANRVKTVLKQMHDQGKIDDATYEQAKNDSIRNYLNPGVNIGSAANDSSYFTDYIASKVLSDLQTKLGYSYSEAYKLLYEGGLIINSTLDMTIQTILEDTYADPSVFPKINLNNANLNLDDKKNIVNAEKTKVILYAYKNLFNDAGNLVIAKDACKWNDNGSLTLYKGYTLNFYNTKSNGETEVRIDIKDFYEIVDEQLYSRNSSYLLIDKEYKSRDTDGNVVIAKEFFEKYPDAIVKQNKNGGAVIDASHISLASRIIQPQSAMVIIDNESGQIRGMVGGRGISGKRLYNRATATRQPGSSIKPLALYSTALQMGYDAVKEKQENPDANVGTIFTAATPLDNIPIVNTDGQLWPGNVDLAYHGITSFRKAVEKSVNGCAVNLYTQLDISRCVENVQNLGITTLVMDGEDTDANPSSLALGGMLKGVTPLEMASAYSTFANYGEHNDATCYTTVVNRKGDVLLKADSHPVQVLDEEVASLMLNILESTVNYGGAYGAKLTSQPSAGKTGTTSDKYDIWFCGLTPKYAASTWVGCDSNINLGADSTKAVKVWKAVMEKVGALDEKGKFELKGEFVTVAVDKKTGQLPTNTEYSVTPEEDIIEEIFIKGTEPTEETTDLDARGYVQICASSGYLATPYCPSTTWQEYLRRPGGMSWENLLANYDLRIKPEKDEEGNLPPKEEWEEDDKTQYLTLIEDSAMDEVQFYCPIHNNVINVEIDPETEEETIEYEYPISPFADYIMYQVPAYLEDEDYEEEVVNE